MAERRMFARTIIDSDAFLDMPLSTQSLYFHLSMRADDEGFVNNPKKIQRMIGASEDDLKLLIAKNFIIPFDSGIVVIKHWRIHNYLRSDRFKETVYQEEKSMLEVKDNGAYTIGTKDGIPLGIPNDNQPVYQMDTQDSIGKDSIDKDNNKLLSNDNNSSVKNDEHGSFQWLIDAWNVLSLYGIKPISRITSGSNRENWARARLRQYGKEAMLEAIENIKYSDFLQGKHSGKPWMITFDWFLRPNNFPKVLEGNYGMKPKEGTPVPEPPKEEEFDLERWEKENGFV